MGKAVDRVRREMDVLAADCGYTPDGDGGLIQPLIDYKDALEQLVVELAEKLEQRGSAPPRSSTTVTSSPAAANDVELRRGSQRWQVVYHLAGLNDLFAEQGRTAEQISAETGLSLNSVSTRMSELVRGGWVKVASEQAGKSAYVATTKAVQFFQREAPLAV